MRESHNTREKKSCCGAFTSKLQGNSTIFSPCRPAFSVRANQYDNNNNNNNIKTAGAPYSLPGTFNGPKYVQKQKNEINTGWASASNTKMSWLPELLITFLHWNIYAYINKSNRLSFQNLTIWKKNENHLHFIEKLKKGDQLTRYGWLTLDRFESYRNHTSSCDVIDKQKVHAGFLLRLFDHTLHFLVNLLIRLALM